MYRIFTARLLMLSLFSLFATTTWAAVTPSFTITKSQQCSDSSFTFTSTSTTTVGTITSLTWDFGDATSTTGTSASRTYAAQGTYTVRLTVLASDGSTGSITRNVIARRPPPSTFTFANPVCARSEKLFTPTFNKTTDSVEFFSFDWGDGTSTTNNGQSTKTWTTAGTYNVTLTVRNNRGCESKTIVAVVVNNKVTAKANVVNKCQDSTIFFDARPSNASGSSIQSYQWRFPDGTVVNRDTVTKRLSPGSNQVKLIVTNNVAGGCGDSLILNNVIQYDNPKARITYFNNCEDSLAIFYDASSAAFSLNSWKWNFGHGGAGNTETYTKRKDTLKHAFPGAGTYTVTLTLETKFGCKTVWKSDITIHSLPKPDFTFRNACKDTAIQFTDVTPGSITNRFWYFGDSTNNVPNTSTLTNPNHKYNKTGNFKVKLITRNTNGCQDSITKILTVYPAPKANFSFTDDCEDTLIKFTDLGRSNSGQPADTLNRWFWNFGDGGTSTLQNPSHQFANSGSYTVRQAVFNGYGCSDTTSKSITIYQKAASNFTYPLTAYENDTVTITSTSTVLLGDTVNTYFWFLGNGNQNNGKVIKDVYTQAGTFNITQINYTQRGCVSTSVKSIEILPAPQVTFTYAPVCFGRDVQFTSNVIFSKPATVQSYLWDFGDTSTSTLANPIHRYSVSRNYTVKLTVTATNGSVSSYSDVVIVQPNPKSQFSVNNNCFDSTLIFISTSNVITGNIVSWNWNFGDSTTGNGSSVTKKYSRAGNWNVILKTTTDKGCVDSIVKLVRTFPLPKTRIGYLQTCGDSLVQFTDFSTIDTPGSIVKWKWEVNGDTSSLQNPKFKFPRVGGTYPIKVTVYSDRGCPVTFDSTIYINPLPRIAFNAPERCEKNTYNFFDISPALPNARPISWNWKFGDGRTASGKNVSNIFDTAGNYRVVLTVKSERGCVDSLVRIVVVYPLPKVKFYYNGSCFNEEFNFVDSSEVPGGIQTRLWQFGDASATTSSSATPTMTYTDTPGVYRVRLTITAANGGCSAFLDSFIRVFPLPVAKFTTNPVCQGNITIFTDATQLEFGTISEYRYDFGDGTRATYSSGQRVVHRYDVSGSYPIKMTVYTDKGCFDDFDTIVEVKVVPIASFTADPRLVDILNPTVTFKNTSKGAIQYLWDFGDNETSIEINPKHIYEDTGDYIITLAVINSKGCTDTFRMKYTVYEVYSLFAPNAFTPNDDGTNDEWKPIGAGYSRYKIIITDSWGQKVFESNNIEEAWKGTYLKSDKRCPIGTYVYKIETTDVYDIDFKELKGVIHLLY